ncbi:PREDICTED: C-X-C chemokine receptor type 6 [Calidris pugnax]|uniref:C-X-C chemokine receptor type 6 n=1 Tax=Calidris pugnax TaxID=198806 RepID=UPI00071DFD41|nr:PREDICTED: C-X-C chemokine receptor type 6 [Calidris pugnax]XP_014812445.1 PREDICTED: C-X-C chemokine receptor type 6 [Calidris pugnax]
MTTSDADNFYYNFSSTDSYEDGSENLQTFTSVFLPCVYSVVFILGLAGNALVFVILVFYEKLKTLTDVFLVNLAIADWVFLWTLPFWAYSAGQEWTFGTTACRIIRGLYILNLYTSMLTLTSITFDRLIAITFATKAHMCQTKRMTWGKLVCVLIWVISLAFATPQFIFSKVFNIDKAICQEEYPNHGTELALEVIQVTLGYFIPMLAMIICYSLIIRTLLHARSFQKNKSLKKIFSLVAIFLLTQSPYTFLRLIKIINWSFNLNSSFEYAIIITEALAYFHGCLNPVLYFFMGVKFRRNLQKIIKNSSCIKRQVTAKQWQTTEEEGSKTFTASNNAEATSMYPL